MNIGFERTRDEEIEEASVVAGIMTNLEVGERAVFNEPVKRSIMEYAERLLVKVDMEWKIECRGRGFFSRTYDVVAVARYR